MCQALVVVLKSSLLFCYCLFVYVRQAKHFKGNLVCVFLFVLTHAHSDSISMVSKLHD